jgi:sugar lactone lactonase YvrE
VPRSTAGRWWPRTIRSWTARETSGVRTPRARFGATDGCGFDQDGNLWVTLVLVNKIVAITPSAQVGTLIHDVTGDLMSWPTNVRWGGDDLRDLYIGSVRRDYVLHARSSVPGLPLSHQRCRVGRFVLTRHTAPPNVPSRTGESAMHSLDVGIR